MQNNRKIRLGVLFGGQSCEHEVSVVSARCVYQALDLNKYDITLIGIAKSGEWVMADDPKLNFERKLVLPEGQVPVMLDPRETGAVVPRHIGEDGGGALATLDVIFPILHGPYGEDGTVQGLLELSGIAYVGSGVTGSAVGMDKAVAKSVYHAEGIPQAKYEVFRRNEWVEDSDAVVQKIESSLPYPLFTKPANLGSSVGITKVKASESLVPAIEMAFDFDMKIVVEQSLENCHEVEVSVLGNNDPVTSVVGEIIPGGEFYDYEDKYVNDDYRTVIPVDLPDSVVQTVQNYAIQAFTAIDASGLARADFFVSKNSHQVYINELNTMPGFTPISMYPQLWEASGLSYVQLLDRLIELAIERYEDRKSRKIVL